MKMPNKTTVALVLVAAVAVPALIALGRLTADRATARSRAVDRNNAYFDGLQVGEAQGRREGRALQEGNALPPTARRRVHDAFDAGYVAGANDVFAGYDGGWAIGVPYVVTIAPASHRVVYRIKYREPMQPNVDYYLCAGGHAICHEQRR